MYSKSMCLSGLIVAGVMIVGAASGDHHERPEGSEPGTPDQAREQMADPAADENDQLRRDPHEGMIGTEESPGRSADEMRGEDSQRMERTRDLPPVGAKAGEMSSYTVESGDTLGSISERFLGSEDRWKEIAKANDIGDPNTLEVGMKLTIPDRGNAENPDDDDEMERKPKTPDRQDPMERPGAGT